MTFNNKWTGRTVRIPDYAMALTKKRLSIWFISSAEFVREHRIQKKRCFLWLRPFCIPAFRRLRLLQFTTKCGLQFHNTSLWWSSWFKCAGVGLIKIEDNFTKRYSIFWYIFNIYDLWAIFTAFDTKIELRTFKNFCFDLTKKIKNEFEIRFFLWTLLQLSITMMSWVPVWLDLIVYK